MSFGKIGHILILCVFIFLLSSEKVFAGSFEDGVNAYQTGNYYYAENYFKKALREEPNDEIIKYYLAISLARNKKNNEAKVLYREIVAGSSDQQVVNLAREGLNLLGEKTSYSGVSRAVLNVNASGGLLLINNVNINNKVKVQFIFDTGATYTMISSKIAKQLGISTTNVPKLKIMTGSGYINAPKIILNKIEVNGLAVYNVEALVADLPLHNSGQAGNLAGLLGLSFMKDFRVTVDRPRNKIILER